MTDLQKDILIGLLFISGIFSFISGGFIVSAVVFATAALFSNVSLTRQLQG